ncbi:Hypothetical predicted protein [Paramuricea clavata]|uniref:Uncharacterized protein n=1 Tax=Paramuricea clavata TaxID=317549 RepID=A0A6S7G0Y8_PARCT|nr:Hypothetical predicted protein [Paramuricea clavata]CAB4013761.1 Hypothetical predicted protein [Paramuricea clavata]
MNSAGGGGGRDRDKGRKYQSGSGKRKAKEERAAREKKVLSKMPKISEMLSATKTSNSAVLETVDIVGGTHLADNLNPEIFKELEHKTHYVDTTTEVAAECKSVCDDDHIDIQPTLTVLHTYT